MHKGIQLLTAVIRSKLVTDPLTNLGSKWKSGTPSNKFSVESVEAAQQTIQMHNFTHRQTRVGKGKTMASYVPNSCNSNLTGKRLAGNKDQEFTFIL
jgi:hypothetical protein